jgi:hypothetical protein
MSEDLTPIQSKFHDLLTAKAEKIARYEALAQEANAIAEDVKTLDAQVAVLKELDTTLGTPPLLNPHGMTPAEEATDVPAAPDASEVAAPDADAGGDALPGGADGDAPAAAEATESVTPTDETAWVSDMAADLS